MINPDEIKDQAILKSFSGTIIADQSPNRGQSTSVQYDGQTEDKKPKAFRDRNRPQWEFLELRATVLLYILKLIIFNTNNIHTQIYGFHESIVEPFIPNKYWIQFFCTMLLIL